MIRDIVVGSAEHARDWVDYATLVFTFLGLLVLTFYTWFTARLLKVNQETLAATREALKEARANNSAALEETRKSYDLNRQALVLSRRIWLNIGISGEPLAGFTRDAIWVSISSVGAVPATTIRLAVAAFLAPTAVLEAIPDLTLQSVAPLGVQATAYYRAPFDIRTPENRGFPHDHRVLHVVCRVAYDDGFGEMHPLLWAWHLGGETLSEWRSTPGMQHIA